MEGGVVDDLVVVMLDGHLVDVRELRAKGGIDRSVGMMMTAHGQMEMIVLCLSLGRQQQLVLRGGRGRGGRGGGY